MSVVRVQTVAELQAELDQQPYSLVTFSALAWCVPCQRFNPHMTAAAEALPDIKFIEVDADTAPELVNYYDIQTVPTVKFFNNGTSESIVERTALPLIKALRERTGLVN